MRPRLGIDIAAPADRVWHELVELRCWPRWGPTVRSARLDDGTGRLYAGATGSVRTAVGVSLPFEVDGWGENGQRRWWSWRVAGVEATEHSVTVTGPEACRLEMSVPWWAPAYLSVIALALRRIRGRAERG